MEPGNRLWIAGIASRPLPAVIHPGSQHIFFVTICTIKDAEIYVCKV